MQTITFKNSKPDLFKIICYPDRQSAVELHLDKLDVKKPVKLNCRIEDFFDIEILLCLVASLRKNDFFIETIIFSYLFGMRSDRAFTAGQCNYFRDIIAPIINGLKIPEVYVFAPHNFTVLQYINAETYKPMNCLTAYCRDSLFLWGDESANFLMNSLSCSYEFSQRMIGSFSKKREDGLITGIYLNEEQMDRIKYYDAHPIVIVDDLCDGGATFIAEAKYLRENGVTNPLHLFVAHGLFTKGVEPLLGHFEKIICTNSYSRLALYPKLQVIEII